MFVRDSTDLLLVVRWRIGDVAGVDDAFEQRQRLVVVELPQRDAGEFVDIAIFGKVLLMDLMKDSSCRGICPFRMRQHERRAIMEAAVKVSVPFEVHKVHICTFEQVLRLVMDKEIDRIEDIRVMGTLDRPEIA